MAADLKDTDNDFLASVAKGIEIEEEEFWEKWLAEKLATGAINGR